MNVDIDALEELLRLLLLRKESGRKSGATMSLSKFINDTDEGRKWYVSLVMDEYTKRKKKEGKEGEEGGGGRKREGRRGRVVVEEVGEGGREKKQTEKRSWF